MLARTNRFHGHNSVRRAYRLGKPVRDSLMSLHYSKSEKIHRTKVAVVVSRKVHKSAVKRNRIRRRIFEIVRHHISEIKQPTEIVFTIYKLEVIDLSDKELKDTVVGLLNKAKIL